MESLPGYDNWLCHDPRQDAPEGLYFYATITIPGDVFDEFSRAFKDLVCVPGREAYENLAYAKDFEEADISITAVADLFNGDPSDETPPFIYLRLYRGSREVCCRDFDILPFSHSFEYEGKFYFVRVVREA